MNTLPADVVREFSLEHLSTREIFNLSQATSQPVFVNDDFWQNLVRRDFPSHVKPYNISWRQYYTYLNDPWNDFIKVANELEAIVHDDLVTGVRPDVYHITLWIYYHVVDIIKSRNPNMPLIDRHPNFPIFESFASFWASSRKSNLIENRVLYKLLASWAKLL